MPLIAIEGLDGAGKSTQIQLLAKRLRRTLPSEQQDVHVIHFPRLQESQVGGLLRSYLSGQLVLPQGLEGIKLLAMLFATDRAESRGQIAQWLDRGEWVLVDRYYFSNLAYQCAKVPLTQRKELADWIYRLEREVMGMPIPDAALYLDVPLEFCEHQMAHRRAVQGSQADIHESDRLLLRQVQLCYAAMATAYKLERIESFGHAPSTACPPAALDSSEQVAHRVWGAIERFLHCK